MYERLVDPPISRARFIARVTRHVLIAAATLAVSMTIGIWGYSQFGEFSPLDSFLNVAVLLGGMGQVFTPKTPAGILFAGIFALYAGLIFFLTVTVILTPIVHRMLRKFYWNGQT